MNYTVEMTNNFDEFLELKHIWNELLAQSPTNTYFMRWEWLSTWWDIYQEKDDELNVILIKDENNIVCIAPFYTRKRVVSKFYPSRILMFIGTQFHGEGDTCSDFMDFIYNNKRIEEKTLTGIITEQIDNNIIYDEIYLSKIDTSSTTMNLLLQHCKKQRLSETIRERYVSPYIKLPSSWDAYMNSISASMRYKIRREQRKLEKNYNVNFRKSENITELNTDYQELIRLHTDWWKKRSIDGAFSDIRLKKFHERLMPVMLENNHLDLHFMREDSNNLAVLYLIKYNKKVYFYQSGIESNKKKSAFGYIMHSYCISNAIDAGFTEYDFLPDINTDSYKQKYTKVNREIVDIHLCKNKLIKTHTRLKRGANIIYRAIREPNRQQ